MYKNPKEPIEARVNDLLSRMTLREKIAQLSTRTGLTESRIMEDCMICGYAFLYGTEEDSEHIVSIMRVRYGNIIDAEWLKSLIKK